MIEISEDSTKVEKSQDEGVVHELLEGYIGRRVRVKLMGEGYPDLKIDTRSGVLESVTVTEYYDPDPEVEEAERSSFGGLKLSIAGKEDEIEVDFDGEQLQVEVFQKDSGRWILIYRSKHWKKMLKSGSLG